MRAYAMLTTAGIRIGAEYLPGSPATFVQGSDPEYCKASLKASTKCEEDVEFVLGVAADSTEPWWFLVLFWAARVLWFLRPTVTRLRERRCWSFDGFIDHHQFECCTWSVKLEIPDPRLRRRALEECVKALFWRGYVPQTVGFNLPPAEARVERVGEP